MITKGSDPSRMKVCTMSSGKPIGTAEAIGKCNGNPKWIVEEKMRTTCSLEINCSGRGCSSSY